VRIIRTTLAALVVAGIVVGAAGCGSDPTQAETWAKDLEGKGFGPVRVEEDRSSSASGFVGDIAEDDQHQLAAEAVPAALAASPRRTSTGGAGRTTSQPRATTPSGGVRTTSQASPTSTKTSKRRGELVGYEADWSAGQCALELKQRSGETSWRVHEVTDRTGRKTDNIGDWGGSPSADQVRQELSRRGYTC
jgi:hypothetical protein